MQVHQHRLFKVRLAVIHHDRIIVPIQPMDEGLDARFVDLSDIRRRLPGLLASKDGLWTDETESVNHNFTLHGLNGVDHYGDRTRV